MAVFVTRFQVCSHKYEIINYTTLQEMFSTTHIYYVQSAELSLRMDERVRSKIADLTRTGVRHLAEMKRHLKQYVEEELFTGEFIPSTSDARFWPSNQNILSCMYRTSLKLRFDALRTVFSL